jgi:hypothetical protein
MRYINHSQQPTGHFTLERSSPWPKYELVRPVQAGEQITAHYGPNYAYEQHRFREDSIPADLEPDEQGTGDVTREAWDQPADGEQHPPPPPLPASGGLAEASVAGAYALVIHIQCRDFDSTAARPGKSRRRRKNKQETPVESPVRIHLEAYSVTAQEADDTFVETYEVLRQATSVKQCKYKGMIEALTWSRRCHPEALAITLVVEEPRLQGEVASYFSLSASERSTNKAGRSRDKGMIEVKQQLFDAAAGLHYTYRALKEPYYSHVQGDRGHPLLLRAFTVAGCSSGTGTVRTTITELSTSIRAALAAPMP